MESTYIVLAGGYWLVSKEFGKQVNRDAGDMDRMADYVIRVDNLPKNLVKPEGCDEHIIYHCEQCDRDISEGEMEHKFGCFGHKMSRKIVKKEKWDTDKLERYTPSPRKWMKDCFRIWMSKEKGLEKWREIHTYLQGMNPTTIIPQPVAVGDRGGWQVDEETIPVIVLPEEKGEVFTCEVCGKAFSVKREMIGHMAGAHKKSRITPYEAENINKEVITEP